MGLGKTVQTLTLMLARAKEGPTLVVAPASVCQIWIDEAARFAPTLRMHTLWNGDREQIVKTVGPFDVLVTSYGLLLQEEALLSTITWGSVVLDEAQNIKNEASKRSQAAKSLQSQFRMVATGTPIENHLGELWNLFDFLNPGLLGNRETFVERFISPMEKGDRTSLAILRRLVSPFILRRRKSDVLKELPPRTEITMPVILSEQEAALYEVLRQQALDRLEDPTVAAGERHLRVLAELMKLHRVCCHPRLVAPELGLEASKLKLFEEILDELLDNNHKTLVFSQFVDHLTVVREALDRKGVSYQYLDGSTPQKDRKAAVEAFQAGEGDVFLISLRAGGFGLNLTAADYVVHMDTVVESCRRGSGLRPGAPHRPAAARHRIPSGGQGDHRRENAGAAPLQA